MKNKGFALIEVLVGLGILAFGLLSLAGMQVIAIRGDLFGRHITQAAVIAQSKLEELTNLPYGDAKLNSGQYSEQVTESGTVYRVCYDVTALGNTMKKLTATVVWEDRGDHTLSLSTIKAKNDG